MMLRSFIAVEIPPEIQNEISRSIAPLQKALPKPLVRWVAAQNVHLTLKFLGDVSSENLDQLANELRSETINHESFCIPVGGVGAFPNPRRARVIWIGLEASPALKTLLHGVEAVAAKLGYAAEERPFSPHLTVGRVGKNISGADPQTIQTALERMHVGALGTIRISAVHVFKSDLRPEGPIYTCLYTLPMKPAREEFTA